MAPRQLSFPLKCQDKILYIHFCPEIPAKHPVDVEVSEDTYLLYVTWDKEIYTMHERVFAIIRSDPTDVIRQGLRHFGLELSDDIATSAEEIRNKFPFWCDPKELMELVNNGDPAKEQLLVSNYKTASSVNLFGGVACHRLEREGAQPVVVTIMVIDLHCSGISFAVTPPDGPGDKQYSARQASEQLSKMRARIAVNASYLSSRDPMVDVSGVVISNGDTVSPSVTNDPRVGSVVAFPEPGQCFSTGKWAMICDGLDPPDGAYNAFAAGHLLLKDGKRCSLQEDSDGDAEKIIARTAFGISKDGNKFFIFACDGGLPEYSHGLDRDGVIDIFLDLGVTEATCAEGDGSTTLVMRPSDGAPVLLSRPVYQSTPNCQCPIGPCLLVYAASLDANGIYLDSS